jgi:broad specificity phosphatase PhoE
MNTNKRFKSNSDKTLVLIRHAHRDASIREKDNGLSKKGLKQAVLLVDTFKNIYSPDSNTAFLASPKKRCQETVEGVAEASHSTVVIEPLLSEQESHESHEDFKKRIHKFLDNWAQDGESLTFACTHGDWLPLAMKLIFNISTDFEKASWAEIALEQQEPILRFRTERVGT